MADFTEDPAEAGDRVLRAWLLAAEPDNESFANAGRPSNRNREWSDFETLFYGEVRGDKGPASRTVIGWNSYNFSVQDAARWIAAGLTPGEFDLAHELTAEGIDPDRLGETVSVDRAPITLLQLARGALHRHSTLGAALDDAGVERQRVRKRPHRRRT